MRRIFLWGLAGTGAVAAVIWGFRPDPVAVDLVAATRAPMEVTVAAEGMTRIREPWSVTAPISGTVTRSPVHVGDLVTGGETVVAVIQPAEPAFLDARARLQAEAAVTEAEAAVRLAEANFARAEADLDHADSQLERNMALAARGAIAQRVLEDSIQRRSTAAAALDAARSEVDLNRAILSRMQAQLVPPEAKLPDGVAGECCVQILAPHSGTVLAVEDLSARLVQAGSPLLSIGNLDDLEIEVDLLSTDAVRIRPGMPAHIDRWGGPDTLAARVRQIEPAAFTKVSALGIEEQRVRVRLDILAPASDRPGLGDRYQVFAHIAVWRDEDVLQVPVSALYRSGPDWAVLRAEDGRAVETVVTIGQRTGRDAEILSGLSEGDRVIAYPGSRVGPGSRISARTTVAP